MKKSLSAERPKLLADENISASLVQQLRSADWDVTYIAELEPGLSDQEVLELSRRDRRCLLTEDHDFGDLIFRQQQISTGVVLLRTPSSPNPDWTRVLRLLDRYRHKLKGSFTVIEPERIRFRPL